MFYATRMTLLDILPLHQRQKVGWANCVNAVTGKLPRPRLYLHPLYSRYLVVDDTVVDIGPS